MQRVVALLALVAGCGIDVEIGRECPAFGADCSAPAPMMQGAEPIASSSAPAGTPAPLSQPRVRIEYQGASLAQLALSCEVPCGELTAVAEGGTPPYAYQWEDGSTAAVRVVCPGVDTRVSVRVVDASMSLASTTAELGASTPIASAELNITTPACDEALGDPDEGATDVGGTLATKRCDALRWEWAPHRLMTTRCAPSLWALLLQPLEGGKLHEVRIRGQGLWQGHWTVELWGTPDGCELVEKLGEFRVGEAPVHALLRFVPAEDHRMIVLNVVRDADSGSLTPYLGYRLCTPPI